ncbi:metallophosphoesterase [Roseospirillum parvum]|uniref:Calcineurin-like phosphoesterase n=1 Tax=Roseospirillum parvum TaxID=83401 RepID=A0A1G8EEL4_9PROT|nr:metallophosphoesterase [Roseospirillum parvum]SDH68210.1 Calcineurin-like phosphoesterase [Roseospirillum parvum]
MYDLIGDIHGRADELEALLVRLGYRRQGAAYRHTSRQAIFVGDFVDRGPHQRRVLDLVRPMIDGGAALAVMGNHEFNAIAYHTADGAGGHLRPRNERNTHQHRAFLDEFADRPAVWAEAVAWFRTLPLWLDLPGLRVIHACWDAAAIRRLAEGPGAEVRLDDALLHAATRRGTWQYRAVETLLKGKEIDLPEGAGYADNDGIRRHQMRVRWWGQGRTYRDLYLGPESAAPHIPDDPIDGDHLVTYGRHEKPLFVGHYWMQGTPEPLAPNIACLDYSVAKPGGKLVAYRWDGEAVLRPDGFVACERGA